MKVLHKLRPKVKIHTDFFVLDTENGERDGDKVKYNFTKQFIFACIVGHNFEKTYFSKDELINDLKTNPLFKDKIIFAHNAEYDLTVIYDNIYTLDPEAIFNGKFICATNGHCRFADSMNIFVGASVDKIGKLLGMPKHDIKYDHWYPCIESFHINYCLQDCRIIYEALIRTFEFASDIKITQASLSMAYFRRFHLPFSIEHNDNTKYFWDSYFGGRTEAFKIGKTHSHVIDVNSMYPDRMKHEIFPNPKFLKLVYGVKPKEFIKRYLYNYEGCVFAEVSHKKTTFGFLPVKHDGKLLFPVGRFKGCWNFNEFRFALEQGAIKIISIEKVVYAPGMESPFVKFVDHLYHERFRLDNEFEIDRVKRFMNSLYGKFAQRVTEEHIYIENIEKQINIIHDYQRRNLFINFIPFNSERLDGFLVIKTSRKVDTSFSIPSFASYITSGARVVLLTKLLELEKCRPVYCDTDSIFFEINNGFESTKKLGGWKLEDKTVTEIRGLKNYKYIDGGVEKHRLKGVPKSATKISDNTYEYFNLLKTKESLRRDMDAGIRIKRTKVITGKYTKRIVLENGETKPIEL